MSAFTFLSSRLREKLSWMDKRITSLLQAIARISLHRPIYTVVAVAALASSSYIGLLEGSLSDATISATKVEWPSLVDDSRRLRAGPETTWKWQTCETEASVPWNVEHFALITFVFSQTTSAGKFFAPPTVTALPVPANVSITALPSTANAFSTYAQDSALALSVSYHHAPDLLRIAQEISNDVSSQGTGKSERNQKKPKWVMKAVPTRTRDAFETWAQNAWVNLRNQIEHAQRLDIVIMVLSYFALQLTLVSLFRSMRRMGSNFWLAAGVLFSSVFGFLFGLSVTVKLGVPITALLLSEGLPFLVVMVGFEKHIALTRAVLSRAARMFSDGDGEKSLGKPKGSSSLPQFAIQGVIKEEGFKIVKNYAMDIGILVVGAASGIEAGLQHFCFLSAWILFFDCILLFSFYTTILYIKLEVNRIKRHVEMREALVHDGVSRRVAEKVAQSDWLRADSEDQPGVTIFGQQTRTAHINWFKFVMVLGFFLINALNIYAIPLRGVRSSPTMSNWARGFGNLIAHPPFDPFGVASDGLDVMLDMAKQEGRETVVTVLSPIRYELELPSVHHDLPQSSITDGWDASADLGGFPIGGRMVGGVLKSLETPVLSRWILVALVLSIAFNGYLFNAATAGSKGHDGPHRPIDPLELAQAQSFTDTDTATLPLEDAIGHSLPSVHFAPAPTENERNKAAQAATTHRSDPRVPTAMRSQEQLEEILQANRAHELMDEEIVELSMRGRISGHALEKTLKDFTRAVKIRRTILSRSKATADLTGVLHCSKLPYQNYDWAQVFGACCENVIGYMPVPVGIAGPLVVDGRSYFIPMATTEGVLVASTSRGCKAINAGGGAVTVLTADGMTRAPVVMFKSLERAGAAKLWLDSENGRITMKRAFNSTSRFARLESVKAALAGTHLFIRFKATTGDAMGMNMISKGAEHALSVMMSEGFDDMDVVSLSGNYCADKKASAVNWIDGRGKTVVAEAVISRDVVKSVLKTDVDTLVKLNQSKNLIGSAVAGSISGFNAHAANMVAAMFIATGQDPAQVVESANCITIMNNLGGSLQISVSMPSLEVGTLGGGTILEPQGAMLDMLGVRGPHATNPGDNARRLARIVAAVTLAGELSLCSALAAGQLVKAHMQYNRSTPLTKAPTPTSAIQVASAVTSALGMAAAGRGLSVTAGARAR